jgi:DNA-directed RNA polymerase specialized sigma24 family protein
MAAMTATPAVSPDAIESLRARYLVALEVVQRSADRTIAALVDAREAREVARRHALQGRPMAELGDVIEPQALRASLGDALADLERTRHDAQRLLFQLMHAEGLTLADIGRAYGISRQLVSRLVNEPDPVPAG